MVKEFIAYCTDNSLIRDNDNLVIGVSGGADSMCLLFLLIKIREQMHLNLVVVHINHLIREEAGEDASYVEQKCREWDVPFILYEKDVRSYASEYGLSEEEAGRKIRYLAFEETLEKYFQGDGKIAVAHNRNDRAETVMFNLFRGTGLKGLSGISVKRDHIIRPILFLDRQEIERYLLKNEIVFCVDATNAEDTYTRNRIRKHIIGYAQNNICQQATQHINEAANLIEEAQEFLSRQTEKIYDKAVTKAERGLSLDTVCLQEEEPILIRYCIMKCISVLTNGAKDITGKHIRDVALLFSNRVGKRVSLPYGLTAVRGYKDVRIERNVPEIEQDSEQEKSKLEYGIVMNNYEAGQEVIIPLEDGREAVFQVLQAENHLDFPTDIYTKWFDYDKIEKSVVLRNRKKGDFLTVDTAESVKTLKKYMIDEKIPKEERDSKLLLADQDHILWVIGYRISQHYKVTEQTKKVLQVQIRGGADNGRKH